MCGARTQRPSRIARIDGEGNGEQITLPVTEGKSYLIVVKDLSGDTNPSYDLTIDGPDVLPDVAGTQRQRLGDRSIWASQSDAQRPDDSQPDRSRLLCLDGPGDRHIAVGPAVQFGARQPRSVCPRLSRQRGGELSTSNIGRELLEVSVEQGQTYLIIVAGRSGDMVNNYDLTVDLLNISLDNYEPNDRYTEPVNLGAGDRDLDALTIHKPFNRDFYRWQAPSDGTAVVDLLFAPSRWRPGFDPLGWRRIGGLLDQQDGQ